MTHRPVRKPRWDEIVSPRGRIQIAVIAALVVWLYWDQIRRMVAIWSSVVVWSAGFLILLFSLYLVHARRDELARTPLGPSYAGLILLVGGIATYAMSIRARVGYSQPLSLLAVLAGAVLLMSGWRMLWHTAFPILYLAL